MNRVTTKPALTRQPPPVPQGGLSTLFSRLHLALTAALLVGLVVFLWLAASGTVRFGQPSAAEPDRDAAAKPTDQEAGKPREKDGASEAKVGRYQIELADDASQVLSETGKISVLGSRLREAWVFRYRGGYAECKVETDFGGRATSSGQLPEKWSSFLGPLDEVKQGNPEALHKEGYIVLLSLDPAGPERELEPVHPHLGAMFTVGPAGPLHSLVPFYHEVWRRAEYRMFLSAGPPKGTNGPGFNLWSGDLLLVRSHFVNDESLSDPVQTMGGKDLEPGKEMTLLERQRGLSTIRLKARFLTDAEAVEKARKR